MAQVGAEWCGASRSRTGADGGCGRAIEGPRTAALVRLRSRRMRIVDELAHDLAGGFAGALGDDLAERQEGADQGTSGSTAESISVRAASGSG